MGLIGTIAKYIGRGVNPLSWSISSLVSGRAYSPDVSTRALIQRYQSWVYACSNKNAVSVAQIPLRLYATKTEASGRSRFATAKVERSQIDWLRGNKALHRRINKAVEIVEVLEHPFLTMLEQVNPYTNGFDMLELTILSQEITGNSYWVIRRGAGNIPKSIWLLLPQYVKVIPDRMNFIAGYVYSVDGVNKHRLEPEDVIHFKYPSLSNTLYGHSPLMACVIAADLGTSMNTYEATLLKNNARPDMVLSLPPETKNMGKTQKESIREEFQINFGKSNRGKLGVLTGGALLKEISLKPKEMAFLAGRKASLNEVASVFGVPMSKLTTDNVNRSNAEAGDYSYQKDTILPKCRRTEQKMNEALLPHFDPNLFCAFDNPVPKDKEFRLTQLETRISIGMTTINEERQIDGMEEVEWGDEPKGQNQLEPVPAKPDDDKKGQKLAKKKGKELPVPKWIGDELLTVLLPYFRKVENTIVSNIPVDLKSVKIGVDDALSGWFDIVAWNVALDKEIAPQVEAIFLAGGKTGISSVAQDVYFEPKSPRAVMAINTRRAGAVQSVNGTIAKNLRKRIGAELAEGHGGRALRKSVRGLFKDLKTYQVDAIARTESLWSFNAGALEGYKQSGMVEGKEWVLTPDDRLCEFCKGMANQVKNLDQPFFYKGDEWMGMKLDYSDIDHPPLHPNCLTGDSLVSPAGDITAVSKRFYDGKVHIIKTASGRELAVTPKHPVFSDNGLVPANSLNVGSYVISSGFEGEPFLDWQNTNKPALVEDIAESFFANPSVITIEVPITSPDFHGDTIGSKVAIIGTDSLLVDSVNPSFSEFCLQFQFKKGKIRRFLLDRLGVSAFRLPRMDRAFDCLMSRLDLLYSLLIGHLRPFDALSLALCSGPDSGPEKSDTDAISTDTKMFSNPVFRPSGDIIIDDSSANFFRDKILHIGTSQYSNYIYNLETTSHYYIAGGIASHNCRCAIVPVLKEMEYERELSK